jgi:hypothetical protein
VWHCPCSARLRVREVERGDRPTRDRRSRKELERLLRQRRDHLRAALRESLVRQRGRPGTAPPIRRRGPPPAWTTRSGRPPWTGSTARSGSSRRRSSGRVAATCARAAGSRSPRGASGPCRSPSCVPPEKARTERRRRGAGDRGAA